MITGYFRIDRAEMTEEESIEFRKLMKSYSIYYRFIKSLNGQDLFHAVISSEENIISLLELLSSRNPKMLGAWNRDGTNFGEILIVDEEGNETIEGEVTYPYQKTEVESYLPNICTYDEDGNVIEVVGKLHCTFAGYKIPRNI